MATVIIEKEYEDYDESKNLPLDELFVSRVGAAYVCIKDLYVVGPTTPYRKVKNYADFKANMSGTGTTGLSYAENVRVPVPRQNAKTKNLDKSLTYHTEIDEKTRGTKYLRYAKTDASKSFDIKDANRYVYLRLSGELEPRFVKLSDICFYNGLTEVKLSTLSSVDDFRGKDLYVNGKLVEKIAVENTFTFDNYKFKIKVGGADVEVDAVSERFDFSDPNNPTKTTYSIVFDKNGAPTFNPDGTVQYTAKTVPISKNHVTHAYVTKTIEDAEKPGQTKDETMVEMKKYKYNTSGEFIKVKLEGQNKTRIVKISDLRTDINNLDSTIDATALAEGKQFYITVDGKEYTTEPLTTEEITIRYNSAMHYEPSLSSDDILKDNAYLQTKDGKFIKEKEAAKPMYYKIACKATDPLTDFDVYVAIVGDKQIVIDKEHFEKAYAKAAGASTLTLDGYSIEIANVSKAKRVSNFSECDVVQTASDVDSNGKMRKIESCKIYKTEFERNADKANIDTMFETSYKEGHYIVNTAMVDGEKIELADNKKRYVYTDTSYSVCYSDYTMSSQAISEKPFVCEWKDGELTISGGPGYNVGKGIKSGLKTYGKYMGATMLGIYSGAGILVAAAAPALLLVPVVGAVVAPLAIVGYNIYKGIQNKFNPNKWENPCDVNEKANRKILVDELNNFKQMSKDSTKFTENHFGAECDRIDSLVTALMDADVAEGFELVDGKVEINKHNVHAVTKFMAETKLEKEILDGKDKKKDLEKKIKALKKKPVLTEEEQAELAKYEQFLEENKICQRIKELEDKKSLTPAEQNELDGLKEKRENLRDKLKQKTTNYKSENLKARPSNESREIVKNAETLKSLIYLKAFINEQKVKDIITAKGLDYDEIKTFVTDLDYDFQKNEYLYKGKKIKFDKDGNLKASFWTKIFTRKKNLTDIMATLQNVTDLIVSDEIKANVEKAKEPKREEVVHTIDKDKIITDTQTKCLEKIEQLAKSIGDLEAKDFYARTYKIIENVKSIDFAKLLAGLKLDEIDKGFAGKTLAEKETILNDKLQELEDFEQKLDDNIDIVAKSAEVIEKIEAEFKKFTAKNQEIYDKINDNIISKLLSDVEKSDINKRRAKCLYEVGEVKKYLTISNPKHSLEDDLKFIEAKNNEMNKISEDVTLWSSLTQKDHIINMYKQHELEAQNNILSLRGSKIPTEFQECLNGIKFAYTTMTKLGEKAQKKATAVQDARLLVLRTERIKKLISVAVASGKVVQHVMDNIVLTNKNDVADVLLKVTTALGKIKKHLEITEDTSFEDLDDKVGDAKDIYEKELKPFLNIKKVVKTPTTKKKKKKSAADLQAEADVLIELKNPGSHTYQEILKMLTNPPYSKAPAQARSAITRFINLTQGYLKIGESAYDHFTEGSINWDILDKSCLVIKGNSL